jgi:hypothetical protein
MKNSENRKNYDYSDLSDQQKREIIGDFIHDVTERAITIIENIDIGLGLEAMIFNKDDGSWYTFTFKKKLD